MIIGILSLQLSLFEAQSLKDKRRILLSLKDRIRRHYNVSIAEVGQNEVLRSALLGVAIVANESRFADSALSKVVDFVRKHPQVSLVDYTIEMV